MSMGFVLIFATVFSFARCCSQTCKDVNYELIISFVSLSLSRPHQLHLSLRANQRLRSLCRRSRRQSLRRRGSLQSLQLLESRSSVRSPSVDAPPVQSSTTTGLRKWSACTLSVERSRHSQVLPSSASHFRSRAARASTKYPELDWSGGVDFSHIRFRQQSGRRVLFSKINAAFFDDCCELCRKIPLFKKMTSAKETSTAYNTRKPAAFIFG